MAKDTQYYLDKCKLMEKDLVDGAWYFGDCRNSEYARWNAKENQFYYKRYKFGSWFIESIKHPESDNGFDLFIVKMRIHPDDVPQEEKFEWSDI